MVASFFLPTNLPRCASGIGVLAQCQAARTGRIRCVHVMGLYLPASNDGAGVIIVPVLALTVVPQRCGPRRCRIRIIPQCHRR